MPLKHGNHDCHSFPYKVIQRKRCFFLKIKTVVHKLLTCESHKGREVQIHSHETSEGKPCQIIPPYPPWIYLRMLITNHINHLHTGGPLCTKSLDQAWGHQAWHRVDSPAHHLLRWPRHMFLLPIFILPLLMCLLFTQPLQGQGQHYWVPYGGQLEHTTNPTNLAVLRC